MKKYYALMSNNDKYIECIWDSSYERHALYEADEINVENITNIAIEYSDASTIRNHAKLGKYSIQFMGNFDVNEIVEIKVELNTEIIKRGL